LESSITIVDDRFIGSFCIPVASTHQGNKYICWTVELAGKEPNNARISLDLLQKWETIVVRFCSYCTYCIPVGVVGRIRATMRGFKVLGHSRVHAPPYSKDHRRRKSNDKVGSQNCTAVAISVIEEAMAMNPYVALLYMPKR
jgi:hypothetical protein